MFPGEFFDTSQVPKDKAALLALAEQWYSEDDLRFDLASGDLEGLVALARELGIKEASPDTIVDIIREAQAFFDQEQPLADIFRV